MLALPMKAPRSHTRLALIVFCVLAVGLLLGYFRETLANCRYALDAAVPLVDLSGARVAIVETETYHDEVEGAIIYDFVSIGVQPTILRTRPYRFGFEDILRPFYQQEPEIVDMKELGPTIRTGGFDLVIFVTCSWKFDEVVQALVESNTWVVCIVHHADDKHKNAYRQLAKTRRFSLVALSEHTASRQLEQLEKWAEIGHAVEWDGVDVHVDVPVFPGPMSAEFSRRRSGIPSRVVIQGSVHSHRRNYNKFFRDILPLMEEDLASWGYYQEAVNTSFLRLPPSENAPSQEPFTIHLLGQVIEGGEPEVPIELENMVYFHQNLDYIEYYELLATMDLLLPAFYHDGYYISTASSSIPAALIGRVPVLASPRHTRSYGYLAPPAVIMRPPSMTDARAVQMLRQGQAPMPEYELEDDRPTFRDWDSYLSYILQRNRKTWLNVLGKAMSKNVVLNLQAMEA